MKNTIEQLLNSQVELTMNRGNYATSPFGSAEIKPNTHIYTLMNEKWPAQEKTISGTLKHFNEKNNYVILVGEGPDHQVNLGYIKNLK